MRGDGRLGFDGGGGMLSGIDVLLGLLIGVGVGRRWQTAEARTGACVPLPASCTEEPPTSAACLPATLSHTWPSPASSSMAVWTDDAAMSASGAVGDGGPGGGGGDGSGCACMAVVRGVSMVLVAVWRVWRLRAFCSF